MGGRLAVAAAFEGEAPVWLRIGDVTGEEDIATNELRGAVIADNLAGRTFDINDWLILRILDSRRRVDGLRRAAEEALAAGAPNLAIVLNALAAETTAASGVSDEMVSRAFGGAAAFARGQRRLRAAEALARRSLETDPTNMRTRAMLGQTLHQLGEYGEAIEHLTIAARVDNRSKLYLGWSKLRRGALEGNDDERSEGCSLLVDALTMDAYNAESSDRRRWVAHLTKLAGLGEKYEEEVGQLVAFANGNSKWGPLDVEEILCGAETQRDDAEDDLAWEPVIPVGD